MKQNKTKQLHVQWFKVALIAALASVVMMIWVSIQLCDATKYQQHMHAQTMSEAAELRDVRSQAHFANAVLYVAQGQWDKALNAYAQSVAHSQDPALTRAAYFNAGNLYLNQATERLEQQGLMAWDEAGPLVALAKERYQQALRLKPDWSEAKYNYQLAYRLAPTKYGKRGPQRYEDESVQQEEDTAGWPAMPGNPRGMP